MESTLYNNKGEKAGKVKLPESIFGLSWNADLVHQVVVGMRANARRPVAHTKTRGEVRGGGKKPWQQKGTGRARHGSSRSPIWKGGGITHGPRSDKGYAKKISQKMRQKALLVTLSRKLKDNEVIFIDSLEMQAPKTKEAQTLMRGLIQAGFSLKRKNAALVALPTRHAPTMKSFGNFGNVEIEEVRNLNPVSVLSAKYLVIANPEQAFEIIGKKQVVKTDK
jgi:large subunit ribosomal protein L4